MYICGYSCQGGTYFQMGKSSSKADEVAQRQALLTEIKRGKSHPEICISFYFNCVFFQTPTGYWWADLEQGGRGGETEEWSHGRRHEWSMDWLSRWAVGKCKQNYVHCRNWAASALRHTVLSTLARRGFTFPRRRSGTDMAVYII